MIHGESPSRLALAGGAVILAASIGRAVADRAPRDLAGTA
jgi:hypothetical protein